MPSTSRQAEPDPAVQADEPAPVGSREFRDRFGEELRAVLDIETWLPGWDLAREYSRIEHEVHEAVQAENELQRRTRATIFPRLFDAQIAGGKGGVFRADWDVLRLIHRGLLFNGGVEACDGTVQVHDALPLTVYQVGISLVSYRGDQGTWHQRLFRRDLRQKAADPIEEALAVLQRRADREALNHSTPGDRLGELARKSLMDYAERAILLHRSSAVWRMGHGNPITYELLTGADILELMMAATTVLRGLIEGHRKFVFVASEPRERLLLTIGQALPPLHYAIAGTLRERLEAWFHQRRFTAEAVGELLWDGEPLTPSQWIPRFLERVAGQVVVGLYRATPAATAQLFYAHADHAHTAAHIALADSMFQDQRGFPLLLDLAHHVCDGVFGGSLRHLTETAYASAGTPWRYLSERTTRND
ncbi:MAG TPA: hypothetical protein VNK04_18495 [Gemmataceae bacterium]|jgi:hypothetical protein|nr:hypothetical protein [Gemmataceae bacterium]